MTPLFSDLKIAADLSSDKAGMPPRSDAEGAEGREKSGPAFADVVREGARETAREGAPEALGKNMRDTAQDSARVGTPDAPLKGRAEAALTNGGAPEDAATPLPAPAAMAPRRAEPGMWTSLRQSPLSMPEGDAPEGSVTRDAPADMRMDAERPAPVPTESGRLDRMAEGDFAPRNPAMADEASENRALPTRPTEGQDETPAPRFADTAAMPASDEPARMPQMPLAAGTAEEIAPRNAADASPTPIASPKDGVSETGRPATDAEASRVASAAGPVTDIPRAPIRPEAPSTAPTLPRAERDVATAQADTAPRPDMPRAPVRPVAEAAAPDTPAAASVPPRAEGNTRAERAAPADIPRAPVRPVVEAATQDIPADAPTMPRAGGDVATAKADRMESAAPSDTPRAPLRPANDGDAPVQADASRATMRPMADGAQPVAQVADEAPTPTTDTPRRASAAPVEGEVRDTATPIDRTTAATDARVEPQAPRASVAAADTPTPAAASTGTAPIAMPLATNVEPGLDAAPDLPRSERPQDMPVMTAPTRPSADGPGRTAEAADAPAPRMGAEKAQAAYSFASNATYTAASGASRAEATAQYAIGAAGSSAEAATTTASTPFTPANPTASLAGGVVTLPFNAIVEPGKAQAVSDIALDTEAALTGRIADARGLDTRPVSAVMRPTTAEGTDALQEIVRAAMSTKGSSSIELRLDPSELGQLDIELSFADDRVSITVRAENETALDLMRRSSDDLMKMLRDAGLDPANLDFSQGGSKDKDHDAPFTALVTETGAAGGGDSLMTAAPGPLLGSSERVDIRI